MGRKVQRLECGRLGSGPDAMRRVSELRVITRNFKVRVKVVSVAGVW